MKSWSKSGTIIKMPRKIEISHKTIVFTALFLVFLWLIYYIRDIILEVFVAILISSILNPFVSRLSKFKIPRTISIIIVYAIFFGIFSFTIASLIPPLIEQTTRFATGLPEYFRNLGVPPNISEGALNQFSQQLANLPSQILKISISVFSNILSLLAVFIFAFYFLLIRNNLYNQLAIFFGDEKAKEIGKVLDELEFRLGGWSRGQFTLMLLVGLANYIGLTLLGIPFALPLAFLAGILEVVPYIGPIIAAIPSVVVGLGISPVTGLAVFALAFLVQQVENYIFVPKIMEESVGVSPIVTLLALAIGFRLAGVVGIIISVPVVITLQIIGKKFTHKISS